MRNIDILRGTPSVGLDRDAYARHVEPRPSRFAEGGAPYSEWAKRADEWARAMRSGATIRRHPGHQRNMEGVN